MQTRLSECQRKQEAAVDKIRDNITEIKNKSILIEDSFSDVESNLQQLEKKMIAFLEAIGKDGKHF